MDKKKIFYDVLESEHSLVLRKTKGSMIAGLVFIAPLALIFMLLALFAVQDIIGKSIFLTLSVMLILFAAWMVVHTFSFEIVINAEGVYYKNAFKKSFIPWDEIKEIGICCSKSKIGYQKDYPQTAIYFSSYALSERDKRVFFGRGIRKGIICLADRTSDEMTQVCETVEHFIGQYTTLPVERFDCFFLKYGVRL